jgi:3-hydroxyacyl-CoA dehydrogenase
MERALSEAEHSHAALVIASGENFAFGADLHAAMRAAAAGQTQALDAALTNYQRVMLRLRYAAIPTVAAVRGVAVSGGCEVLMHCTRVVAHARSRIGLFESAAGVVPGGGGLKELAYRASLAPDPSQALQRAFDTIATATIARSTSEAQQLGFLTPFDVVNATDPLAEAIEQGRNLQAAGYFSPPRNPTFAVLGSEMRRQLQAAQTALLEAGKLTAHQFRINMHIAQVLCGGDAAGLQTEADLLALERLHFLVLAQTAETQARYVHLVSTGMPLVN